MMRNALVFAALCLLPAIAGAQTRLLRQPTYSNGRVAFSYLGSIWVANDDGSNVQRLTVNSARDTNPRFSPDGKTIAFSSNREGNYDVYTISADGGRPHRLTFHSADDMVVGWTPDGKKIIFESSRNQGVFPGVHTLFEIAVTGGMEQPIPTDWGSSASYSPDGSKIAFTRHPGVWSRKHYRGSYAVDLWLMDVNEREFTHLGDDQYKGNYLWPMYGHDGEIYFVADKLPDETHIKFGGPVVMKSANNIWKISEHGGPLKQVTHFADGNLFFPSISADGKTIVFEENFGLWKLDVGSGEVTQIPLHIKSDLKDNDVEIRTIEGELESFSISPSGRRAAIATHGEIFSIATERGEVQRVSETPWREEFPQWSPDGKWIAYISDRSGREEIWMSDELGHNLKQLTYADCEKGSITWAPDSKSLLWSGSDHKLRRVDIETCDTQELVSSDIGPIGDPEISPDSKWISYTKDDNLLRSRVYLRNLATGEEHMIGGDQFMVSYNAKWTPDGKTIVLLGGVGAPAMSSLNRTSLQVYAVPLTRITRNPDEGDINTEAQAEGGTAGNAGGGRRGFGGFRGAPADGGSDRGDVKIEWDGLDRRIHQLGNFAGVMGVYPSPDSRTFAVVAFGAGGAGIFLVSDDGARIVPLVQGPPADAGGRRRRGGGGGFGDTEPQWSRDGRTIYYMQGGGLYAASVGGGIPAAAPQAAPSGFTGRGRRGGRGGGGGFAAAQAAAAPTSNARRIDFVVRLEIDHAAERKQVFEEAWRTMRDRFYDPKMHGVNWIAAKWMYEPLLNNLVDTDELHNVIMQMIGELNASHTGISGGQDSSATPTESVETRYPGFDLEPDSSGYYKVGYIFRKGPADHDYVKLATGNYILAVNGRELKTTDNYWKAFNLVSGRKFDFTVNSKPKMEGAWSVAIEPLSGGAQSELEYERWVDTRKEMVDKLSNGQIGYLHIRAMDAPSLDKFERDLLDNLDKKALLIDERFNGGGGIDQELLEILNQRKKYEFYRGRDSVNIPRPIQAFFGPMAVLQNERSASNAEMFPEGFRTLGLGKVIGVPTYGAVIGTGAYRLLDGSSLRTPSFGVYTANGTNFENYGVQPDVWVDNGPADFLAGHDRQIEKAVEVLKSEMK